MFSEVDLEEVKRIKEALDNHLPLKNIDLRVLTCLFDGHSVFSLFGDNEILIQQVLKQLKEMNHEKERDSGDHRAIVDPFILRCLQEILCLPYPELV